MTDVPFSSNIVHIARAVAIEHMHFYLACCIMKTEKYNYLVYLLLYNGLYSKQKFSIKLNFEGFIFVL